MRSIVSIILVFVLTLPFGLKMGIVTHYWANMLYYATELCENTDKPELRCEGKCQVTKEISKTESNRKSATSISLEEINLFTFSNFDLTTETLYRYSNKSFSSLSNHYIFTSLKDFFHPPEHYWFS